MKEVIPTQESSFYDRTSKKLKRAIGTGALAISLAACSGTETSPVAPTPTMEGTQAVPVLPTETPSEALTEEITEVITEEIVFAEEEEDLPVIGPQSPEPTPTVAS